ncbi:hypothetical protein Hanom_Chr02g00152981 [Helianthus anomalus]
MRPSRLTNTNSSQTAKKKTILNGSKTTILNLTQLNSAFPGSGTCNRLCTLIRLLNMHKPESQNLEAV